MVTAAVSSSVTSCCVLTKEKTLLMNSVKNRFFFKFMEFMEKILQTSDRLDNICLYCGQVEGDTS